MLLRKSQSIRQSDEPIPEKPRQSENKEPIDPYYAALPIMVKLATILTITVVVALGSQVILSIVDKIISAMHR